MSDTFFNHLESEDQEKLLDQKRLKFKGDEVETLFQDFRLGDVAYDEYVLRVSDIFGTTKKYPAYDAVVINL